METIDTRCLLLRTFSAEDADDLFACISPKITRFMAWEPPASATAFAEVWRGWLTAIQEHREHYFVVRDSAERRCLGIVAVHACDTAHPELGIWLREDSQGRGLGGEAVEAVLRWASGRLEAHHFEYPVAQANVASRRIAERLGGIPIGERKNPKYDAVVYAIPPQRRG